MMRKSAVALIGIVMVLVSGYSCLSWGASTIPSAVGTYNITGPMTVTLNLNVTQSGKKSPLLNLSVSLPNVGYMGETFTFGAVTSTVPKKSQSGPFSDGLGYLTGTWTQALDAKNAPGANLSVALDLSGIISTLAGSGITATVASSSFTGTINTKHVLTGKYSYTINLAAESGAVTGTLKVSGNGSGTLLATATAAQYGAVEPGSPESLAHLWSQLRTALAEYKSATKR
jgi:hypothetical protein